MQCLFPVYLMRMLDLVGSAWSMSAFFCANNFLMVFASLRRRQFYTGDGWIQKQTDRETDG